MTPDGQAICDELRESIARSGWSATARRARVRRETLHRAFPDVPNGYAPNFRTVDKVAAALGYRLQLVPLADVHQSNSSE